jgi:ankyrin repeat-rich membrane spanning protein
MPAAEKKTQLMTLAREGELTESLAVMMSETVGLNCVDSYGWTPLYEAIHQGHLGVVKLLVEEGADVDHVDMAGWSPLYLAAYYGHLEIVRYLAIQVIICLTNYLSNYISNDLTSYV